jgi:hypothetical protein
MKVKISDLTQICCVFGVSREDEDFFHPKRATFGAMKGSGKIFGDLITPAVPLRTWEVLQ